MARMQETRTWVLGGAFIAVVITVAGWFFAISPVLSDTDSLKSQTDQVEQQNAIATRRTAELAKLKNQLPILQAKLGQALRALPMANGLPEFTRQLNAQADDYGVTVSSVTVGGISAVQTAPAAASPATSSSQAAGSTGSESSTAAPAAAPAPAAGGVMAIAVSLSVKGAPDRLLRWLHAVQAQGPRRVLVTQFGLSNTNKPAGSQLQVQATLFATPSTIQQRKQMLKLLTEK